MPIGFRNAKAFSTPVLGNGQVISDIAINGYENLMSHLAGRGAYAHSEMARRVNGLNLPIVGFKGGLGGGSSAFIHGKTHTFWYLPLGAGYNTISLFTYYRLNKTFQNENKGSNIRISLVLNGVSKPLLVRGWRDTLGAVLGEGYYQGNESLGDLFKLPIEDMATLCLTAEYDSCDGDVTKYGFPCDANLFQSQTFWNGINYIGFALWRDCSGC